MPQTAVRPQRAVWAWACVGLAGSILITLAGPRLAGGPVTWWFTGGGGVPVLYAGIMALSLAWLALGRLALSTRRVWTIGAIWCLPLFLGAPLFSQDVYSYLAQGALLHLGLDPYHQAPAVLAEHGQGHVLNAVSPFWRHTTAPYGPLFLWIVSGLGALAGSNLVLGAVLVRLLDLAGLVLLAGYIPRLARALGGNPVRASWWVLLSPLVLLELVAPAHNDLLMAALLVAGVTLAVEGRPATGIVLCALAATIKLPAAAAIPFITIVWARREGWLRAVGIAAPLTAGVLVAVSLVSGLGVGWISTSVFSTPEKVRLAITPATALGWSVAQIVPVGARGLESALGVVAFAGTLLLGLVLLWRAQAQTMVRYLGIVLIAVAIGGPAAWPWYLSWGLVLLAACPEVQGSRALAVAVAASVLVVKADGILAFPLHTAPVFVFLYLGLAVALVVVRRGPAVAARRLRPLAES